MFRRLAAPLAVLAALFLAPGAQAAFPGGNGKMVFANIDFSGGSGSQFGLSVVDADGVSNVTEIVPAGSGRGLFQPRWSADGQSIVFNVDGFGTSNYLAVADADGSNETPVLEAGVGDPAFSPDGQRIVFRARLDGQSFDDLYVVARSGGTPQRLTTDFAAQGPVWSPDGKTIASAGRPVLADKNRIFTIDVTNLASPGAPVPRTDAGGANENAPEWAPDGSRIYFRQDGVVKGIDSVKSDGSDRQPVVETGSAFVVSGPFVSPDGTKLAYLDAGGVAEIADIDGSDPVPVSRIGDWQPIVADPPAPVCPAVAPKGLVGPLVYALGNTLKLPALKQLACGLGI